MGLTYMPMNMEKFQALKEKLRPDPTNMDQELIEIPDFIQEISEHTAKALQRRDMANNDLKLATAEGMAHLRGIDVNGKKPSEAQITSEVVLDKIVRRAAIELEDAKYELSLWQGLMESARAKSEALQTLSKLWMAGYLTPNTVAQGSRETLDALRRQRPELRKGE